MSSRPPALTARLGSWLGARVDDARPRRWALLLAAIYAGYAVLVVAPVFAAAGRYCYSNFDLGIYSQALARLGVSDPNPWLSARQIRVFNDHFDPILFVGKPAAWLLGLPAGALLTEAVLVAASTVPLLVGWRRGWLGPPAAVLGCALLLFNPALWTAVRYPVHPTTWAVLPMVWLAVAVHRRHLAGTLLAVNLLCACKEELPLAALAMGLALLLARQRRPAAVVLASALAWGVFDFVVRPALFPGFVQPYAATVAAGMWSRPLAYWAERLAVPGMWSRLGSLAAVLLPAAVWAARRRLRPPLPVLALLVPMLAVRLVGRTWGFHYGAPLMAAAIAALVVTFDARPLPRWLPALTLLALVATDESHLRHAARELLLPRRYPEHCPALPERLREVRRGIDFLRRHPVGEALVGGNLVAHLADRDDLYTVGGFQPAGAHRYRYVLVEQPAWGDPFPTTRPRLGELIGEWRRAPGNRVLLDTPYVFLAEGELTADR